jgi:hypothetical protein
MIRNNDKNKQELSALTDDRVMPVFKPHSHIFVKKGGTGSTWRLRHELEMSVLMLRTLRLTRMEQCG